MRGKDERKGLVNRTRGKDRRKGCEERVVKKE